MHSLAEVESWIEGRRDALRLRVRRIPFADLDLWDLTGQPTRLAHRSGKFFTIEGIRVETDHGPVGAWEQPIIRQPEIGVLGIVTRAFDGLQHFLMQAKVEPGNVDPVQLSPTVQATRSNYTRVHCGHRQPLLEYFLEPGRSDILVDQLQGEQGSRFLGKRNRNMIVEVDHDLPDDPSFIWLTLGQIKRLLRRDNLVNMDARSVLACAPIEGATDGTGFAGALLESLLPGAPRRRSTAELLRWLTGLRADHDLRLTPRPLDELDGWQVTDDRIGHRSGRYFSVVAVAVEAGSREVARWSQPLLDHPGHGLNGFVVQRQDDTLHLLVRACLYPGNRDSFELGPTVSRSNVEHHFGRPDAPPHLDLFRAPPAEWVRHASIQSEEGGRFYHYQNHYVVIELPPTAEVAPSPTHRWMTLGQVQELLPHGYFNIEARNLLACLDVAEATD